LPALSDNDIQKRKLRIKNNVLSYRNTVVSVEDCPLEYVGSWFNKTEVEIQFGPELPIAFRLLFSAIPGSGTLEADFGIAGSVMNIHKSRMRAILMEMMLIMKVDKSLLPTPGQFMDIPEIAAGKVKETLSERFTGIEFTKAAKLSGACYYDTNDDLSSFNDDDEILVESDDSSDSSSNASTSEDDKDSDDEDIL
jgi:hypothetical protein